jgi:uncharacterized protein with FMN-binding domain
MKQDGSNKKVANSLVALSAAAVLAVYTAGYSRTRSAANRFEALTAERRPAPKVAEVALAPVSSEPTVNAAHKSTSRVSSTPVAAPVEVPNTAAPAPPAQFAPAPLAEQKTEAVAPSPAAPPWKDGKYLGWGSCRHGDLQAEVVIEGGKIASAEIAQCLTRYSCSVIENLPPQVAERQSPDVDSVSGATQSSDAFYWAVFDALTKAK